MPAGAGVYVWYRLRRHPKLAKFPWRSPAAPFDISHGR
jgi:hypothetical protein